MSLSSSRSGANRCCEVCSSSKSQPMWAWNMPLHRPRKRLAVAPRRVRVAFLVAEGVVPAVVGHPPDHRPLDGGRPGDGERDAHRPLGLERAVGEVAVEPDRDAVAGDRVGDEGDDHVGQADAVAPEQRDRRDHGEERDQHEGEQRDLFTPVLGRGGRRHDGGQEDPCGGRPWSLLPYGVGSCRDPPHRAASTYASVTYGLVAGNRSTELSPARSTTSPAAVR